MSILIYRDANLAGAAAATVMAAQIIENPHGVLGLDCSREIKPVYRGLAKMTKDGLLDWSDVTVFSLYERVKPSAGGSVLSEMTEDLFGSVNIAGERMLFPASDSQNWSISCQEYESRIMAVGGIDTLFAAIAADGSIAFNRGATDLAPVTHVERDEEGRVVTVGMKTLMGARKIVAFLSGKDKASVAKAVLNGPVTPKVPASYLQLHRNAVFILDEDAASLL